MRVRGGYAVGIATVVALVAVGGPTDDVEPVVVDFTPAAVSQPDHSSHPELRGMIADGLAAVEVAERAVDRLDDIVADLERAIDLFEEAYGG